MTRMIPVIDLRTGELSFRPSHAQTLDLPRDIDRALAIATLDDRSRARYASSAGGQVVAAVYPRPLSWRVKGEECLLAENERLPTIDQPARFTLVKVDPARA